MGTVGDAYDNAVAESFFASLECELIDGAQLEEQGRGAHGAFHMNRGLVQPATAPLGAELPVADQL
jgi:putative transposase